MNSSSHPSSDKSLVARALEVTIPVGFVVVLLFWCFRIAQPFIQVFVWGIIIAVAIFPAYGWLGSALGGRKKLAAVLINRTCRTLGRSGSALRCSERALWPSHATSFS